MIDCDLNRRIRDNRIAPDDVAQNASGEINTIRISRDLVVFYRIVRIGRRYETDPKIISLTCISIPACPVLTEPVVARACRQSYAAACSGCVAIPNRNIPIDFIEGRAAS